jgi:hypothetical protein
VYLATNQAACLLAFETLLLKFFQLCLDPVAPAPVLPGKAGTGGFAFGAAAGAYGFDFDRGSGYGGRRGQLGNLYFVGEVHALLGVLGQQQVVLGQGIFFAALPALLGRLA